MCRSDVLREQRAAGRMPRASWAKSNTFRCAAGGHQAGRFGARLRTGRADMRAGRPDHAGVQMRFTRRPPTAARRCTGQHSMGIENVATCCRLQASLRTKPTTRATPPRIWLCSGVRTFCCSRRKTRWAWTRQTGQPSSISLLASRQTRRLLTGRQRNRRRGWHKGLQQARTSSTTWLQSKITTQRAQDVHKEALTVLSAMARAAAQTWRCRAHARPRLVQVPGETPRREQPAHCGRPSEVSVFCGVISTITDEQWASASSPLSVQPRLRRLRHWCEPTQPAGPRPSSALPFPAPQRRWRGCSEPAQHDAMRRAE